MLVRANSRGTLTALVGLGVLSLLLLLRASFRHFYPVVPSSTVSHVKPVPKVPARPGLKPDVEAGKAGKAGIVDNHDSPVNVVRPKKAVVMAKVVGEDTTWTKDLSNEWMPYIYSVDDKTEPLHTSTSKGGEAAAFLTHITENYHSLADIVTFVHSHDGLPNPFGADDSSNKSVADALTMLQTPFIERAGYVSLCCNPTPDCKVGDTHSSHNPLNPASHPGHAFAQAWTDIFGDAAPIPNEINTPCCGQFAASRKQVQNVPRAQYLQALNWIKKSELDDDVIDKVFENLWPSMFRHDAFDRADPVECLCNLYALCYM